MIATGATVGEPPEPLVYYRVGDGAYERRGGSGAAARRAAPPARTAARRLHHARPVLRNVSVRGGYRLTPGVDPPRRCTGASSPRAACRPTPPCRGDSVNADLVVAGAGLFGLTVAERCAASSACGCSSSSAATTSAATPRARPSPATGIEVHRYGAHLFHTSNERVWEYVNRFTAFTDYRHRVFTIFKGRVYPMPINLGTICEYFGRGHVAGRGARAGRRAGRRDRPDPENLEEKAISLIGRPLYEAFIRGYTAKQWQTDPRELPAGDHHPAAGALHLRQPLLRRHATRACRWTATRRGSSGWPTTRGSRCGSAPTSSTSDARRQRPGRLHRAAGPLLRPPRGHASAGAPSTSSARCWRPATSRAPR